MKRSAHHIAAHITSTEEPSGNEKLVNLCTVLCLIFVLAEGVFLALSRPAIRILLPVAASLVSIALLWLYHRRQRNKGMDMAHALATRIFPIALACTGMAYLFFFPPGTIPDEGFHYGASCEYANLFDPAVETQGLRKEDVEFVTDHSLFDTVFKRDFWDAQKEGLPLFSTHEGTSKDDGAIRVLRMPSSISLRDNPPQTKLPSALGILLARLLNLSGVATFYLGRLFNFLWSFLLIIVAVRLTPIGKNAMMAASLMPMTLHLLGSYSYDATIIGLGFLLTSLLFRILHGKERASVKVLCACVVVSTLLAPCKMVYYAMSLMALVVPSSAFRNKREMIIWKTCMLAIPLATVLLLALSRFVELAGIHDVTTSVRLGETGTFYTIPVILSHPIDSLYVFLNSLHTNGDFYLKSMVGGSLAWFQAEIASKEYQVFLLLLVLLLTSIPSEDDGMIQTRRVRIASLACVMIGMIAIFASMWLGWTFQTENIISGVQGRYFIPFLPLLLMAMRGRAIKIFHEVGTITTMVLVSFDFVYLAQIATVILSE